MSTFAVALLALLPATFAKPLPETRKWCPDGRCDWVSPNPEAIRHRPDPRYWEPTWEPPSWDTPDDKAEITTVYEPTTVYEAVPTTIVEATPAATTAHEYPTEDDYSEDEDDDEDEDEDEKYPAFTIDPTPVTTYTYPSIDDDVTTATTTIDEDWHTEDPEETEWNTDYEVPTPSLAQSTGSSPTLLTPSQSSSTGKASHTSFDVSISTPTSSPPAAPTVSGPPSSVEPSSSTSLAVSSPSANSTTNPSPSAKTHHDGKCGKNGGYTCIGFSAGECCSPWGWCGKSFKHCAPTLCDARFGKCGLQYIEYSKPYSFANSSSSAVHNLTKTATIPYSFKNTSTASPLNSTGDYRHTAAANRWVPHAPARWTTISTIIFTIRPTKTITPPLSESTAAREPSISSEPKTLINRIQTSSTTISASTKAPVEDWWPKNDEPEDDDNWGDESDEDEYADDEASDYESSQIQDGEHSLEAREAYCLGGECWTQYNSPWGRKTKRPAPQSLDETYTTDAPTSTGHVKIGDLAAGLASKWAADRARAKATATAEVGPTIASQPTTAPDTSGTLSISSSSPIASTSATIEPAAPPTSQVFQPATSVVNIPTTEPAEGNPSSVEAPIASGIWVSFPPSEPAPTVAIDNSPSVTIVTPTAPATSTLGVQPSASDKPSVTPIPAPQHPPPPPQPVQPYPQPPQPAYPYPPPAQPYPYPYPYPYPPTNPYAPYPFPPVAYPPPQPHQPPPQPPFFPVWSTPLVPQVNPNEQPGAGEVKDDKVDHYYHNADSGSEANQKGYKNWNHEETQSDRQWNQQVNWDNKLKLEDVEIEE